jgi:Fe(3+) dicitrate transport protein
MNIYTIIKRICPILICCSTQIFGQSEISGNVIGSEKEPLVGALVYSDRSNATYTNKSGGFELKVSQGKISVTVEYLGFESYTATYEVAGSDLNIGTITLAEGVTQLKEVNVSATPKPYKESFEGTNYYVSPIQMKQVQPISTEEILKTLPGVNVLGDMGLSNRLNVSIRGSWGRRSEKVLMMEDGSAISPAPYIAPGIYYNPISDRIDAIEVYTGADVLKYGPNNMFGIINYITPKPPQKPGLRAKISGGERGYFTGLLSYGGTWNKVGSQIEAVYKKFDGFTKNSSVEMLNLNAKIFAEISKNQSLYFKISGQFEENQATLAAITPYTFKVAPTENPFDAERFLMHRYGLDIVHKWVSSEKSALTTKIYASDFARDWWRQDNRVILASDVRNYVGSDIFSERYAYLEGKQFGPDDYVRVGRIVNGRESTTDSRWNFTVAGIEETFQKSFQGDGWKNDLEIQAKFHHETYKDRVLSNDVSRWARTGVFTTDKVSNLQALSGYIRNHFEYNHFQVTPILRFETARMEMEDWLALGKKQDLVSDKDLGQINKYSVFQPGLTLGYQFDGVKAFGSVYKGYIAPSKYYAFLVERDGVLVNPLPAETISNIKPEVSINSELGIRGDLVKNKLAGQIAVFNNRISNFYLGGWNEFFDKLGEINIKGFEAALRWEVLPKGGKHALSIQPNITLLRSKVLSGEVYDRHLFNPSQIRHTAATRAEFISKANGNPVAHDVYVTVNGVQSLLERPVTDDDLNNITKVVYKFGKGLIEDGKSPYTPEIAYNLNAFYSYKNLTFGLTYNYVGTQYAEFANFENESGDGGVGKIKAYKTIDLNFGYDFNPWKGVSSTFFIVGKNLANDVFVASRLSRGQAGIMPGGFRQINAGINLNF